MHLYYATFGPNRSRLDLHFNRSFRRPDGYTSGVPRLSQSPSARHGPLGSTGAKVQDLSLRRSNLSVGSAHPRERRADHVESTSILSLLVAYTY